jgi:uncharacterized membrane protein
MSEDTVKEHHAIGGHAQDDAIFELALGMINYLGSWILLLGVSVALFNFGLLVVQYFTGMQFRIMFAMTQPNVKVLTLDHIKLELGRIVSFSLLLLVAADVLETLQKPMHELSMEDLYKMALVGAIRTTLAFFLGKEMEEILHHIAHAEHEHHGAHGQDHAKDGPVTHEVTSNSKTQTPAGNKSKKKKN